MAADDDAGDGKRRIGKDTMDRIKKEAIYGVGYGRPPKEHQFQKGKSGNERGRPPKSPPDLTLRDQPLLKVALDIAEQPIRIREGDKVSEVSTLGRVDELTHV